MEYATEFNRLIQSESFTPSEHFLGASTLKLARMTSQRKDNTG